MAETIQLLRGYCAFCCRPNPGASSMIAAAVSSSRVDNVQVSHSKNKNGLPFLELDGEGQFCEDFPELADSCAILCRVCGEAVIKHSDERPFRDFLSAMSGETPPDNHLADYLHRRNCVISVGWDMPIHKACGTKRPCGDYVPKGFRFCQLCERVKPKPVEKRPAAPAPKKIPAFVAEPLAEEDCVIRSEPKLMTSEARVMPPIGACEPLAVKPRPAPPKKAETPSKKALETAAKNTRPLQFSSAPDTPEAPPKSACGKRKFNLQKHGEDFKPERDGYIRLNGRPHYRFPDGRTVPVSSGVNAFTPDGELIPG